MLIKVKKMDGNTVEVEIDDKCKVSQLKEVIRDLCGVETHRQRLIYTGKVLQDENEISVYNINDGDSIHLVVRPANLSQTPVGAPGTSNITQIESGSNPPNTPQVEHIQFEDFGNGVIMGAVTVSADGNGSELDINNIISRMVSGLNPSTIRNTTSSNRGVQTNQQNSAQNRSQPAVDSFTASASSSTAQSSNNHQLQPTTSTRNRDAPQNHTAREGLITTSPFIPSLESSLSSMEALVHHSDNNVRATDMLEDLSYLDARNYPATALTSALWDMILSLQTSQLPILQLYSQMRDLAVYRPSESAAERIALTRRVREARSLLEHLSQASSDLAAALAHITIADPLQEEAPTPQATPHFSSQASTANATSASSAPATISTAVGGGPDSGGGGNTNPIRSVVRIISHSLQQPITADTGVSHNTQPVSTLGSQPQSQPTTSTAASTETATTTSSHTNTTTNIPPSLTTDRASSHSQHQTSTGPEPIRASAHSASSGSDTTDGTTSNTLDPIPAVAVSVDGPVSRSGAEGPPSLPPTPPSLSSRDPQRSAETSSRSEGSREHSQSAADATPQTRPQSTSSSTESTSHQPFPFPFPFPPPPPSGGLGLPPGISIQLGGSPPPELMQMMSQMGLGGIGEAIQQTFANTGTGLGAAHVGVEFNFGGAGPVPSGAQAFERMAQFMDQRQRSQAATTATAGPTASSAPASSPDHERLSSSSETLDPDVD